MDMNDENYIPPPPYPEREKKRNWSKFAVRLGLGVLVGGVLGYVYYQVVGCPTGGCTLTAQPEITTGYGMILGAVAGLSASTV